MRISDWSSDVCSSDLNIDAARRATCAHPCRERHRRRRPAGGKSMKVIVLGAGVVGVTSAWYLAEAGPEVVLVDRQTGPALETSFAKAGEISPGYAPPWAAPGLPAKGLPEPMGRAAWWEQRGSEV